MSTARVWPGMLVPAMRSVSAPRQRLLTAFALFLGRAPRGYKWAVLAALATNVFLLGVAGPVVTSWALVLEFIATLAMALKCYPLAPGGLLAVQAVMLGLTSAPQVYDQIRHGLPIILLLLFMVAAIGFMRELLVFLFSKVLTAVRSGTGLALMFCGTAAVLSAFLDALTVVAVVSTVSLGFFSIYFQAVAGLSESTTEDLARDDLVATEHQADLEQFRAALRGLLMHAAVGSALGGVCTLVGEPQNLLIGHAMGWNFLTFARNTAPVSLPILLAGLVTCALVSRFRLFGFGEPIPANVRAVLLRHQRHEAAHRTARDRWRLLVQAAAALLLVLALALHLAEVGLVGLAMVVFLTTFLGVTDEHHLADGMKEAIPFTALLVVFFAVVAVITDQALFKPVIDWVLAHRGRAQVGWLYLANGALSAISDNVFVATVYMSELQRAFAAGTVEPTQYVRLAVAINSGTNIPSVGTPNGQAAFLFLLTSAVAPLLRLSYGRMVRMALPYFVVLTTAGFLAVISL